MSSNEQPTEIILHQQSRSLEIAFDDGARYRLPYEFLRVYTPSAEARGHGPGQEVLQVGKKNVMLLNVEPVGTYALKLIFDDGHDSGLYTWEYLYGLGQNQDVMWQDYLKQLEAAGASREPSPQTAGSHKPRGCGH
ncbi:MAG: DUF971 domain-containing protein [Nitrosomonadales bacterium]|nr:DUF971 domain-containing protein [Nitrosomonadales bacterium]